MFGSSGLARHARADTTTKCFRYAEHLARAASRLTVTLARECARLSYPSRRPRHGATESIARPCTGLTTSSKHGGRWYKNTLAKLKPVAPAV